MNTKPHPTGGRRDKFIHRRLITALLIACVFAVAVCYYFIDRPVAFFVHNHKFAKIEEFRWLTEPPPLAQLWSPLVVVLLCVRRAGGPWRPCPPRP